MLFSLEGYSALITGGCGSIGRAIAIAMANQGAKIAITGRNIDVLKKTCEEVNKETGVDIVTLQLDLANGYETKELFQKAEEKLGSIDILVNNAGIDKDKLFMKMTEEDLYEVLDINLKSVFTLSKSAVMSMSKRKYGRIINMSSVVGFTGNPGQVNYCASKAGLIGMSKAIALEYAKRGITVNCIAPGAVKSSMIDALNDQAKQAFLDKIPLGKMADPMDVAYTCCFLASKEASYITGQTIHVNGGMFIG